VRGGQYYFEDPGHLDEFGHGYGRQRVCTRAVSKYLLDTHLYLFYPVNKYMYGLFSLK
jgi:hypothetical protein